MFLCNKLNFKKLKQGRISDVLPQTAGERTGDSRFLSPEYRKGYFKSAGSVIPSFATVS